MHYCMQTPVNVGNYCDAFDSETSGLCLQKGVGKNPVLRLVFKNHEWHQTQPQRRNFCAQKLNQTSKRISISGWHHSSLSCMQCKSDSGCSKFRKILEKT